MNMCILLDLRYFLVGWKLNLFSWLHWLVNRLTTVVCEILNTIGGRRQQVQRTVPLFSTVCYPPARPDVQLKDRLPSVNWSHTNYAPTNHANNKSTHRAQTSAKANLLWIWHPVSVSGIRIRIRTLGPDDFQNLMGISLFKVHLWQNFHEDRLSLSKNMSQIVEKCSSRNVEESFKNSWIRIWKRITSEI